MVEPKKPKEKEPSAKAEKQKPKGEKYEIPMKCSKEVEDEEKSTYAAPPPYNPPIPYPQRVKTKKKEEIERKYFKLLEVFKTLHINIPLLEAFEYTPSYARFMKDILSRKRKLKHDETIVLTEERNAVLQNKLPLKLKYPRSFTIPCDIGDVHFDKALCYLGTSINLMLFSIFRKLRIREVKPTMVSLLLADKSIKHLRGILENVLVKVDKYIFPVDFIILDMEEDREVSLILGRPFLATRRALIDVEEGKLKLRIQEEKVTFKVFEATTPPFKANSIFQVDVVEAKLSTSSPTSYATPPWKPQLMKIKAKKKKKRLGDDDLKPLDKPSEVLYLPLKPNSISLIIGKKSYYLGDKSPKKGRKNPT